MSQQQQGHPDANSELFSPFRSCSISYLSLSSNLMCQSQQLVLQQEHKLLICIYALGLKGQCKGTVHIPHEAAMLHLHKGGVVGLGILHLPKVSLLSAASSKAISVRNHEPDHYTIEPEDQRYKCVLCRIVLRSGAAYIHLQIGIGLFMQIFKYQLL